LITEGKCCYYLHSVNLDPHSRNVCLCRCTIWPWPLASDLENLYSNAILAW